KTGEQLYQSSVSAVSSGSAALSFFRRRRRAIGGFCRGFSVADIKVFVCFGNSGNICSAGLLALQPAGRSSGSEVRCEKIIDGGRSATHHRTCSGGFWWELHGHRSLLGIG